MTQIQVDYQKLQETKRHNEEMESQGRVANVIANEQAAARWKEVNSSAWNNAFRSAFSGLDSAGKAFNNVTSGLGNINKMADSIVKTLFF